MSAPSQFSIIIPVYNYGCYVGRAIDSALSQPGDDFDVIVADDGSTDDTSTVLQAFGERIRRLRHENCGAAATRNRAAEAATGHWLLFLDADDCLLPEVLTHFRSAIATHPEARMVFGHHISVSIDGRRREAQRQPMLRSPIENFRDYLNGRFRIVHGAVAMRRDNFSRLRYPVGLTNNEDTVLFAQTLALFPCATFPHATAEIHDHGGRMRHNIDAILRAGTGPVEELFQPGLLPAEALRYRERFLARQYLTLARALVKAGRSREASMFYRSAFCTDWRRTFSLTNVRRALCCMVAGGGRH